MLKTISASALKDIIGMLKETPDFFSKDESGRTSVLERQLPDFPKTFVGYLTAVSESDFMADLKVLFQVLDGFSVETSTGFLKAVTTYISHELGAILDQLDVDFFFLDYAERQKKLSGLFAQKSFLSEALLNLFIQSTYQELTEASYQAINQVQDIPTIVVQSPVELSSAQRQEMRESFLEKHVNSFVEFQVNPLLIGGIRVFVEGEVVDHSWLGKVQALTAL